MALLQKISHPRVRILGTEYSQRVVGLHNRLRAHAQRLLVYKDIDRLPRSAGSRARGLFVPGARRLVIYLKRGAPESTVAHELIHALLYTEGFLPLRCRRDDLAGHPEIGALAEGVNNLLVHPVVHARLRRYGFAERRAAQVGGGAASAPTVAPAPRRPPHPSVEAADGRAVVRLLAHAVAEAESRHHAARSSGRETDARTPASRSFEEIIRAIMAIAPWDARRRALDARVKAAAVLKHLEEAAGALWGIRPDLPERILLPPYLTPGRLVAPASRLFDARLGGAAGEVVLVVFRPDGMACSARPYAHAARAATVAAAVLGEIGWMSAAQFIDRHRLEYLSIERRGRCLPRHPDRPTV